MIRDDAENPRSLADGDGVVRHRLSIYRLSDIHKLKSYAGAVDWWVLWSAHSPHDANSVASERNPWAGLGRVGGLFKHSPSFLS